MLFFVALIAIVLSVSLAATNPLGPYKVSDVTVSGLSSGAYMAVQMHVAYSKTVNGSAIFAGGPFYCAQNDLMTAQYKCMKTYQGLPNVNQLVSLTENDAKLGVIDPVDNMKNDRVYLFSGSGDTVVDPKVMHSLQTYYNYFVDPSAIVADYNVNAEHCFPTDGTYGEACATLSSPYIGKCNFDGAEPALKTLFGQDLTKGVAVAANLMKFSQTPYIKGTGTSLDEYGYIYVPTACANGATCHLHLSFHGCLQTQADIGDNYASKIGMNQWAEANNIIVLYPYAKKSYSLPSNPNGCWDWWGYTNKDYGNNKGVQMKFARSLIEAVAGF